jgi:hypothetical protein
MTKATPKDHVRDPSDDEVKELRRWIEKAGGQRELQRWIRFACRKRGKGRPLGATKFADYDDEVLWIAETIVILSREKLTRNKVLKRIANNISLPLAWTPERGASSDVMVKRLHKKALADRRKVDGLTKSEMDREWNELLDKLAGWITSPGDADLKKDMGELFLKILEALNHSE